MSLLVRFTYIQKNLFVLDFCVCFKACFMLSDQRNKLLVGVKFDVLVVAQKVRKGRGGVLAVVNHIVHGINHSRITEPLCLEPLNQYLEELWR